ncbi:MAG: undecaprenyl/decaprenyl-phosphate alpha-N-acetylglucosaminyl 1-phosphate transferase [Candidatus Dormibacteraeota bacterium]|nr:undecaprenyl/decaprenyl-phosphate alpha-N-acetylglucosaminyl 1-phosphate transferase [Candidatus Dormibacteraeota bacterium]
MQLPLSILSSFDPTMVVVLRNLGPALLPFLLAAALGVVLSVISIPVSRWTGMMKRPRGEGRDIHVTPIPQLGGLVLYLSFCAAALFFAPDTPERWVIIGVTGASTLLFLLDDRFQLPYWVKLIFQAAPALAAIFLAGNVFQITYFTLPLLHTIHIGLLAIPLSLFWLMGMQNTANFLDGLDGLAAGVMAIVALVLVVAAASERHHQLQVVVLGAALAGACCGFLFLNFNPARIFMGDSGAHFLGMAVGLLSIMGVAKVAVVFALALPLLTLAVPILDVAWSAYRRQRRGVSFAHADNRHLHHRLVLDLGLTQREVCILFYGMTGILGAVGLAVFGHKKILLVAIVLMVIAVSTGLADRLQNATPRVLKGLSAFLLGRPSTPD